MQNFEKTVILRQPNGMREGVHNMTTDEFNIALLKEESGRTFLADPSTGEKLKNDTLPDLLANEEKLKTGYQFLSEFALRFNLQIVFAGHHPNKPEQLGDESYNFEDKIKRCDVILLEGLGWTETTEGFINDLAFNRAVDLQMLDEYTSYENERGERQIGDTYQVRKLSAIAGSGKHLRYFDIEQVDRNDSQADPNGVREKLQTAHNFAEKLQAIPISDDTPRVALDMAYAKHCTAFEALREWYMVAQTGYQLASLCQNNEELLQKLKDKTLKVMLLVGDTHRDLIRKFSTAGINTESSLPLPHEPSPVNKLMPKWLSQGYIDTQELRDVCSAY